MDTTELRKITEEYNKKKLENYENELKLEFIKKINATELRKIAEESNKKKLENYENGLKLEFIKALTEARHGLPQRVRV